MNILDLHELRDGVSGLTRKVRRSFNPFIHLSEDDPLIRALYAITRPAVSAREKALPPVKHYVKKAKPIAPPAGIKTAGSMVSYVKERKGK
jgi:hypothetical protein